MEGNGDGRSRAFNLDEGFDELRDALERLGLNLTPALDDILGMVERMKATSALLEADYVDPDYRDEYVHYYAFTYRQLPTRCARLHFFRSEQDEDRYLGFCVLRPIGDHPVGRTMLVPPDELQEYVSCTVATTVHPLGRRLQVRAFPFMEQDSQYGRCAHASIWMVALYHHLAHGTPRHLVSDIRRGAATRSELFRATPSPGLSVPQVGAALQHLGLDQIAYVTPDLDKRSSLAAVACRYLNSGMPVILATVGHATVLVGYGRDLDGQVFFVRSDESQGPYRRVYKDDDPLGRWDVLVVPHPGKIYLNGEAAEVAARDLFRVLLREHERDPLRELAPAFRVRTYVTRAGEYKVRMEERGLPESLRNVYSRLGTSTWIWVVELQDTKRAPTSRRCVIGEIAYDGTSSSLTPGPLFANLRGEAYSWPEARRTLKHAVEDASPYLSATAVHDAPTAEPGERPVQPWWRSRL